MALERVKRCVAHKHLRATDAGRAVAQTQRGGERGDQLGGDRAQCRALCFGQVGVDLSGGGRGGRGRIVGRIQRRILSTRTS